MRPFKSVLKHVDRTWNKKQWYETQHWLRTVDRRIHKEINYEAIAAGQTAIMLYGDVICQM